MANKPFDYTIINPLERPTSTDINQLQAQAHYDVRQFAYEIFGRQNGFLGYSFNVEPAVPADGTFWVQQGVAFQYGAVESNIGGIAGLSDGYRQKAVTIENRNFTAEPVPGGAGEKRYDLLMIRALEDTERLTDSTNVGIFTPSLGSFDEVSKYKTLTSSLTGVSVQNIVQPVVGTGPLVYKSGIAGVYASWDDVLKPTVDTGYLGVAFIRRYQGQTSITAADIEDARTLLTVPAMAGGTGNDTLPVGEVLLGNGTLGITSTAILPVSKGGTGNDAAPGTGSVAYYDGTKIDWTRANLGPPDYEPVAGYLLASSAGAAPTWIEPGSAGIPLVSTGTAWAPGKVASAARTGTSASGIYATVAQVLTSSFAEIPTTSTTGDFDIVGNLPYTISILPCADGNNESYMYGFGGGLGNNPVFFTLRITIMQGVSIVRSWQFNYGGLNETYIPPITLTDIQVLDKAGCTFKLEAKYMTGETFCELRLQNCYYFFAQ